MAMKQTGIAGSTLGAVLVAFFFLRAPSPSPSAIKQSITQRPLSAASIAKMGGTVKSPPDGPWMASRSHFAGISNSGGCPPSSEIPVSSSQAAAVKLRQQVWCIPQNERVTAMMAVVPDPVHTHMALLFDRSIEAINLASESADYVMDRYWLPWRPVASSTSTEPAEQDSRGTESQPGLLLFRWNGPAIQTGEPGNSGATLLYVFLVSDTSTDGINGAQFSRAVNYIQQVCGAFHECYGNSRAIRILGPTFSGSLYSLRRLVESRKRQQFMAYSGTVSSICSVWNQGMSKNLNGECPSLDEKPSRVANLEFQPFVTDTETAIKEFIAFLELGRHISPCAANPEVAILSEAATSYGTASRQPAKNDEVSAESGLKKIEPCYANFAYPREISNLRNAYRPSGKNTTAPPPGSENYLPFDLADLEPNKSDETPEFSRSQGPLSKEAVLMDFANDMRREHYKYVGIIGSNVLDVMFLAGFLRNSCPDIRIFVLNSDLLFERDSENAPYIGTLAVATYPMLGRDFVAPGAEHDPSRLPFADGYEQGQFNATVYLLKGLLPQKLAAEPYELGEPRVAGSSSTDVPSQFPLWVSVVGTSGFWPVQVIQGNETPGDPVHGSQSVMRSSDFSPAWKAITMVLSALAFFQVLVLLTASPVLSHLHDFAVTAPACSDRLFFINVASANLALCLTLAAEPAWIYGWRAGAAVPIISITAAIAIVAALLTCLRLNRTCYKQRKLAGKSDRKLLGIQVLYLAIWTLALIGALIWCGLLLDRHGHYGLFFCYRSIHLATGVSPLTPMLPLCACMYAWSLFEIIRLRFNDSARPRLNVEVGFPGSTTEEYIAHSVRRYFLQRNYVIAFFVLLGLWLMAFNPVRPFQLFERLGFGLLYEAWFILVVMLMLSSGLRLGQIWSELRKLLRELERSPIRQAFSRLTGESWSPIWQAGGQEDALTNMSRSFEVLKQIRLSSRSMDEGLKASIAEAEKARTEIRDLIYPRANAQANTGPSVTAREVPRRKELFRLLQEKFAAIQQLLAQVLNHALLFLQKEWDEHSSAAIQTMDTDAKERTNTESADLKSLKSKQESTAIVPLLEQYVALRYVAFIRAVLGHVRLLLIFLAISFSLMLISLNVYSFEPHQSLIWSFTAIFAVIGILAIGVLMEAHRNEILSRVSGTKPNELGWGFYARLVSLGAAPLITLLATHFPSIGKFLLSFFQPGLEALK
jgi:hypothetical protein